VVADDGSIDVARDGWGEDLHDGSELATHDGSASAARDGSDSEVRHRPRAITRGRRKWAATLELEPWRALLAALHAAARSVAVDRVGPGLGSPCTAEGYGQLR
jgi:hypothetical protein